ncbi:unnamed protein product [Urochloa humidicola]
MSRPNTEASKLEAAGVLHSAPAPTPVPVISARRISPRAAVSSIQSRLRQRMKAQKLLKRKACALFASLTVSHQVRRLMRNSYRVDVELRRCFK